MMGMCPPWSRTAKRRCTVPLWLSDEMGSNVLVIVCMEGKIDGPTSLQKVQAAFQAISAETIQNIYQSMYPRLRMVFDQVGKGLSMEHNKDKFLN